MFCIYHAEHSDGLSRKGGVMRDMVSVLAEKFGHIDAKVLRTFARIRTFIRMWAINDARRTESLAKRE